jgi:hypothetical protein
MKQGLLTAMIFFICDKFIGGLAAYRHNCRKPAFLCLHLLLIVKK